MSDKQQKELENLNIEIERKKKLLKELIEKEKALRKIIKEKTKRFKVVETALKKLENKKAEEGGLIEELRQEGILYKVECYDKKINGDGIVYEFDLSDKKLYTRYSKD